MIVVLKENPDRARLARLIEQLRGEGLAISLCEGAARAVLVVSGDTARVDVDRLAAYDIVEEIGRASEPYYLASRRAHPADTVVCVGDTRIGGGGLALIAGPCSVESEAQILEAARAVKAAGAAMLRGGAFKPRYSPYVFQGLGAEGLRLLALAKAETGLPTVSEITDAAQLPLFDDVDVLQVGARNMQNFALLKALGAQSKPVLLKRGLSATYQELLMSAEYILSAGNPNVILCERGIRGFEPSTRNTLDIAAVPALKRMTHLPVLVDPSHAAGRADLVPPLAMAAVAAGADGLMIEAHPHPSDARTDGAQALDPAVLAALFGKLRALCALR